MHGTLNKAYPGALWVHLVRNEWRCIPSLATQVLPSLTAFCETFFRLRGAPIEMAQVYYRFVNEQVASFAGMTCHIETMREDWPVFWRLIRAIGDEQAAMTEFERRYNPGAKRGRNNWI